MKQAAQIEVDCRALRGLLAFAAEFYADPANRKAYRKWKAEKHKQKKARQCSNTDEPEK